MKKLIKSIAISLLIITSLNSCQELLNLESQNMRNLTSKEWKLSSITIYPSYNGISDWYTFLPDWYKDNTIKYDSDNTATIDEGATKESSSAPQQRIITWEFNVDETTITENNGHDNAELNILELSRTKFITSETRVLDNNTYTFTYTFIH